MQVTVVFASHLFVISAKLLALVDGSNEPHEAGVVVVALPPCF